MKLLEFYECSVKVKFFISQKIFFRSRQTRLFFAIVFTVVTKQLTTGQGPRRVNLMIKESLLEAKWKRIRGKVKQQWNALTDEDLNNIDGSREVLIGVLQEKYSYTRQQAEIEVDRFLQSVEAEPV